MSPFESALGNAAVQGAAYVTAALSWVVLLARVVGLRSFAKMSAFDFVSTVAVGSLLASAATSADVTGFVRAMVAMGALFAAQFAIALLRRRSEWFRHLVDNRARVLMRHGEFRERAMREERVARADVYSKLRAADVDNKEEVDAVVLETTGDFSVMSGDDIGPDLLDDVRD